MGSEHSFGPVRLDAEEWCGGTWGLRGEPGVRCSNPGVVACVVLGDLEKKSRGKKKKR